MSKEAVLAAANIPLTASQLAAATGLTEERVRTYVKRLQDSNAMIRTTNDEGFAVYHRRGACLLGETWR